MPTMLTFFLRWQIKSQWWRKKTKKQNRFFYPTTQVGLHFKITNTSTPKWLVLLGGSTYIQFLNSGKQKGLHKIDRPRKTSVLQGKKLLYIFCLFISHSPKPKKEIYNYYYSGTPLSIIQWVNLNFPGSIQGKLTVSCLTLHHFDNIVHCL